MKVWHIVLKLFYAEDALLFKDKCQKPIWRSFYGPERREPEIWEAPVRYLVAVEELNVSCL